MAMPTNSNMPQRTVAGARCGDGFVHAGWKPAMMETSADRRLPEHLRDRIAAVMGTFEPVWKLAMMGTESTPTPASTLVAAHAAATGSCGRDEKPVTTATPTTSTAAPTDARCSTHRPTAASLKGVIR